MVSDSSKLLTDVETPSAGACNARAERRVIAIAGPVHARFSKYCKALDLNQQDVATEQLDHWNRRNARRAKLALKQAAEAFE